MNADFDLIIRCTVNGKSYVFPYETDSLREALEEFYREQYYDGIAMTEDLPEGDFPLEVSVMDDCREVKTLHLRFSAYVWHRFFDHGAKADGPYKWDDFLRDIERNAEYAASRTEAVRKAICSDAQLARVIDRIYADGFEDGAGKGDTVSRNTTRFMLYMWNRWSEEECHKVWPGCEGDHFWNKWTAAYDRMGGARGAAEVMYAELTDTNREKLVRRACKVWESESGEV